jgi:hypothetical protein
MAGCSAGVYDMAEESSECVSLVTAKRGFKSISPNAAHRALPDKEARRAARKTIQASNGGRRILSPTRAGRAAKRD